ncbi:LysM peptidoglycan-binding domain-containing protein [Thiohalorhabdus sp.]|uniref:LysM peptidoglycan-binding domain-containing protein n=1 Tax=Thiohalorhabdus sp. TaxID=3094134 RepID=UPI002FC32E72
MPLRTLLLVLTLIPFTAWALDPDDLRDDAPQVYTVNKGDTLWDIAAKFLDNPWRWPDLWDRNPYISNPDLIYPGDRLRLYTVDGEPRVARQQVERLSPEVGTEEAQRLEAISTVDRSVVIPYVDRYGLLSSDRDPQEVGGHLVAGAQERVMYASGDEVFFRLGKAGDAETRQWYTFRKPDPIRDSENGELLGYFLEHTGLIRMREPAGDDLYAGTIERTYAPVEEGDRIYPGRAASPQTRFMPKPAPDLEGTILRHVGGESLLGEGQMVILDRGARHGLEKGHVLIVQGNSRTVADPRTGEPTHLPSRQKGVVMIIETSEQLAFALIMQNQQPLEAGDRIEGPEV